MNIRVGSIEDLNVLYDIHLQCFDKGDIWYKSIIAEYIEESLIAEVNNTIVGFLLQGKIQPCIESLFNENLFYNSDNSSFESTNNNSSYNKVSNVLENMSEQLTYSNLKYIECIKPFNKYNGIVMLCILPEFQKQGIGTQLVTEFLSSNKNPITILQVRKSNVKAQQLYLKLNYVIVGYIKDKYFFPTEDCIVMVYELNPIH